MTYSLKLFTATIPVLCVLASGPAFANPPTAAEFAQKAAIGGQFEISSSQLAVEKSQNDDVKKFAQQIIADHTQASNTLKATLPASSVKPDVVTEALDKAHQDKLDTLRQASAEDFDEDYIDIQEDAHEDTINLFKDYAKNGTDKALQTYAKNTLPTLEEHLKHARALDEKID
ncbi:MAG TPA: DUF4142 domain-containing protein [Alphaproteobacteria bacterium]